MDIGRKSVIKLGWATFGAGLMYACFHWIGTVDVARDKLNSCVNGVQKTGAPSLRNQDGRESSPVIVGRHFSSALKTCHSVLLLLLLLLLYYWFRFCSTVLFFPEITVDEVEPFRRSQSFGIAGVSFLEARYIFPVTHPTVSKHWRDRRNEASKNI